MHSVQLDHCTLYAPDDSCMVRVDRKGRVVEPAELGDQLRSSSDPADSHQTPIVCLALFTMGRKRLKKKKTPKDPIWTPRYASHLLGAWSFMGNGQKHQSQCCMCQYWLGWLLWRTGTLSSESIGCIRIWPMERRQLGWRDGGDSWTSTFRRNSICKGWPACVAFSRNWTKSWPRRWIVGKAGYWCQWG